jgi:hypothetical protein
MASNASVASSDDSYQTATSGPMLNASPQHRRNLSGESLGGYSELDTPPRDFMSRWVAISVLTAWFQSKHTTCTAACALIRGCPSSGIVRRMCLTTVLVIVTQVTAAGAGQCTKFPCEPLGCHGGGVAQASGPAESSGEPLRDS